MMKIMRRWLITLIAPLLGLVITISILDATVLRAAYIKQMAVSTGTYDSISTELAQQIAASSEGISPAIASKLITPAFVAGQLDRVLVQLEAYLRGQGPQPTLDLSGLKLEAARQGIPLPPEVVKTLDQPVQVSPNAAPFGVAPPLRHLGTVRLVAGAVAAVLLLVLLLVARSTAKLTALAAVCLGTAISTGIGYLLCRFVPTAVKAIIDTRSASSALDQAVANLTTAIASDLAWRFGWVAAGLAAAALVLWVAAIIMKRRLSGEIKPLKPGRPLH